MPWSRGTWHVKTSCRCIRTNPLKTLCASILYSCLCSISSCLMSEGQTKAVQCPCNETVCFYLLFIKTKKLYYGRVRLGKKTAETLHIDQWVILHINLSIDLHNADTGDQAIKTAVEVSKIIYNHHVIAISGLPWKSPSALIKICKIQNPTWSHCCFPLFYVLVNWWINYYISICCNPCNKPVYLLFVLHL